ncbi:MAG: universal stress protein [Eggerthellaceae bacterium]|nr:universal stress protein [Eggerthellaceae bacterium]
MARYNRIFAALDGSDAQVAVARRTLSIAHDNNAEVLFGHVIDTSKFETGGLGDEEIAENKRVAIEQSIKRQLDRARQDECVPSVEVKVAMGPLNDTMMDGLIKPFNPDLVICGVRGLSNIRYAFVGSVSTHIVRHAPCDVLVVRPEAIDELPEEEYAPYEID